MPRKTEYGKFIFSAGEISTYVLCPEAWRLTYLEKVDVIRTERARKAEGLHKEWRADYSDAVNLARGVKYILYLLILSLLVFLLAYKA